MSERELWKIYDVGRQHHDRDHGRYFMARSIEHPDFEHKYPHDVANAIVGWRNSWEDIIKAQRQ